jgi:hypothetical protein
MTGNAEHLEEWENDPWGPAIFKCHNQLSHIIPGYEITQIKEKFGGLRYYFQLPEDFDYSCVEFDIAQSIVQNAEDEVKQLDYEKNMQKFRARIAEKTIDDIKANFRDSTDIYDAIQTQGTKIIKGYYSD